ncbi:MAG: hypothetical protein K2X93_26860 [Candidatus Obscuribacterales bacterium]|nr:hypothetical protein [Candidatus Obscuribacterales bacterium]
MSDRHNTPFPDIALWGTAPKAAKLIAGRYKVEGQLGQGGMGWAVSTDAMIPFCNGP